MSITIPGTIEGPRFVVSQRQKESEMQVWYVIRELWLLLVWAIRKLLRKVVPEDMLFAEPFLEYEETGPDELAF